MLRLIAEDDSVVLNEAQIQRIKHLLLEFIPATVCVVNAGPNANIAVPGHGVDELASGVQAEIEATIGGGVHVVTGEPLQRDLGVCPVCGGPIGRVTLALCLRREDGARLCKRVLRCHDQLHITWRWTDRPDDAPEWDDSLTFLFPS